MYYLQVAMLNAVMGFLCIPLLFVFEKVTGFRFFLEMIT